ncbi:MAG: hypothetical protein GXC73_16475 [Chitinophagaceae bacterium]|nr:hypothetical protein [Chitinophagaceae bacterium]
MELELIRTYFPEGTNGELLHHNKRVCSTIELPWLANKQRISCIPEGRYELTKRYSQRYKHHLHVNDVEGRTLILIHAFNDALKESKGCIAPVSICTGEGKGRNSMLALKKLLAVTSIEFDKDNKVFLTIKSVI